MTFQTLLRADLDVARHALDQVHPLLDPLVLLGRVQWALSEIRAKVDAAPATDQALAGVDQAANALIGRLNTVLLSPGALVPEREALTAAFDGLERVFDVAVPSPAARVLHGV
ncbi:MAG: hypothetical protein E6Q40_09530 [Cupriavidus sp.]|nr:MAG: hypothetical protein E6Q40_09530 [Cupriavidus sp.]